MDNIVIVDDVWDNNEEVVMANAQILDGLPIDTSDNQAMIEQNIDTNHFKTYMMPSGDVLIVMNPDGKAYFVEKEILEQQNIDTNYLTDESIQLLWNMALQNEYYSHMPTLDHPNQEQQVHQNVETTLGSSNDGLAAHPNQQQQGHQNVETLLGSSNDGLAAHPNQQQQGYQNVETSLGSSKGSTSSTDQPNRRKRQNKEIFDPSATIKTKRNRIITNTKNSAIGNENGRKLKFVPYRPPDHITNTNAFSASAPINSSSIRPPVLVAEHVIDLAKISKLPGVVIYKPGHQPSSNSHLPHCVCCHDPIPKSKMDFVWVRLPIHIECNSNNGGDDDADMPVLPSEVNNDKEK